MSETTAEERIASVQKQAKPVEFGEAVAEASSEASEGAGWVQSAFGGPVGLAAYAAGLYSSQFGTWLAGKTDADKHVANGLAFIGLPRIGQPGPDGPNPATIDHEIAHSLALLGFLGSIVVGALAAVAVGALIVATGGAAAVVLIGAAAAGGFAGGFAGTALVGACSQFGYRVGPIITGSSDVFIAGKAAARMTDTAACREHSPPPSPIVEGSQTIFINGLALARVGHKTLCGAVVDEGVRSVVVDASTWACATPASEIPVWLRVTLDWIDFLPGITKPKTKPKIDADPPKVKPAPPKTKPKKKPKTTKSKNEWQQQKSELSKKNIDDFRRETDSMNAPKRGAAYEAWVKENHPEMYGEGRRKFPDGTSTDGWNNSVKREAWDHKHYKSEQLNKRFSGHAKKQLEAYSEKLKTGEIKEFNYVFSDKPSPKLVEQIQAAGGNVYYIDNTGAAVLL
ncbi:MAG TPA: hypothetical protein DCQ04_04015 [Actinobacteria bacterium]|nr:hypothetical protein [Actinomycetota bacterium]